MFFNVVSVERSMSNGMALENLAVPVGSDDGVGSRILRHLETRPSREKMVNPGIAGKGR